MDSAIVEVDGACCKPTLLYVCSWWSVVGGLSICSACTIALACVWVVLKGPWFACEVESGWFALERT